jgi:hypothetical protein
MGEEEKRKRQEDLRSYEKFHKVLSARSVEKEMLARTYIDDLVIARRAQANQSRTKVLLTQQK